MQLKLNYQYRRTLFILLTSLTFFAANQDLYAQHSVARKWNDELLNAIRNDFARPTVHARNLMHISTVMYDAWAAYDSTAATYLLGKTVATFNCPFNGIGTPADIKAAQKEAMSFATYRMLKYRFKNSPGVAAIFHSADTLMLALGYDTAYTSVNYPSDTPAALGNYIAQCMISFGQQDGSNEQNGYDNQYYTPVNPTLLPIVPGNADILDPNRWQPLTLDVFIDQGGNVIPINTPDFLSPEWGNVIPFALHDSVKTIYMRNGDPYPVFHDPGAPAYSDTSNGYSLTDEYQWGFSLVSVWSSHLAPGDSVKWDISPASIGNIQSYPQNIPDLQNFYNLYDGGDYGQGYNSNPITGMSYQPQIVPRGDYARVLAEFWADGPDSETPPGHWFTLLNYVNDHPQLERKWRGKGPVLDDLEWDVKAYFAMGGAVHDAAIAAWGIKGWYDYIRPISAIRYMADQGQSTDTMLANYNVYGIPLDSGLIEMVELGDPLAGTINEHVGKIKLLAWQGPDSIANPDTTVAGVGWILAENWWPYQRPTFVTPPFAGYISGHSTYSRAAAELMTLLTGSEYFPGGMGEFLAEKNNFLVFEDGPSQDITLQWATYRDASDQCSLSRIWGGIHPPVDDIPGRLIGEKLGIEAFLLAERYADIKKPEIIGITLNKVVIADSDTGIAQFSITIDFDECIDQSMDPAIHFPDKDPSQTLTLNADSSKWINENSFVAYYDVIDFPEMVDSISVSVTGSKDIAGNKMDSTVFENRFSIDTENPVVNVTVLNPLIINDSDTGKAKFRVSITYNEKMDTMIQPFVGFPMEDPSKTLTYNPDSSGWNDPLNFTAAFDVVDSSSKIDKIDIQITQARDLAGNIQDSLYLADTLNIDMENPIVLDVNTNILTLSDKDTGIGKFSIQVEFSKVMNLATVPAISFPTEDPSQTLFLNPDSSNWVNGSTYLAKYDLKDSNITLNNIDIGISDALDAHDNLLIADISMDKFHIDTENPVVVSVTVNIDTITKYDVGLASFKMNVQFNEDMDTSVLPEIGFPFKDPLAMTLQLNGDSTRWINKTLFSAQYDVTDSSEILLDIDMEVDVCHDLIGNGLMPYSETKTFSISMTDTSTGIWRPVANGDIRLYPNPVKRGEIIIIEIPSNVKDFMVRIYNIPGQTVYSENQFGHHPDSDIRINSAILPAGIYLVQLNGDKKFHIKKLEVVE